MTNAISISDIQKSINELGLSEILDMDDIIAFVNPFESDGFDPFAAFEPIF